MSWFHLWKPSWQLSSTQLFLFDGQNEIGAADENGRITELRILGETPHAEIGAAVAMELHGILYTPLHDLHGNVAHLVKTSDNTTSAAEEAVKDFRLKKVLSKFYGKLASNKIIFTDFRISVLCDIVLGKEGKMSAKTSRLTIDMPASAHKRLKMAASMMDLSMKELVILSVDEFLHKKPNELTVKAIKQSESGKGVKKFENLDELFNDLGI